MRLGLGMMLPFSPGSIPALARAFTTAAIVPLCPRTAMGVKAFQPDYCGDCVAQRARSANSRPAATELSNGSGYRAEASLAILMAAPGQTKLLLIDVVKSLGSISGADSSLMVRRSRLSSDEARRIASNIAKLPEFAC